MELKRAKPRLQVDFRVPLEVPPDSDDCMDHYLGQLKEFTKAVLVGSSGLMYNKSLIMEYVREMVWRRRSHELSAQLDAHLKDTIESMLADIDREIDEGSPENEDNDYRNRRVFDRMEMCWCHLRKALSELIQVCSQLESPANNGGFSIWAVAMSYFQSYLETRQKMKDRLMVAALDRIADYRRGSEVVFCQIRNIVEMFSFVQVYDKFEERLLAETRSHYHQRAAEVLSQNRITQAYYVIRDLMQHEEECCKKYLIKKSVENVLGVLRVQVLLLNAQTLMDRGELKQIIRRKDVQSMAVLLSIYENTEWSVMLHDAIFEASQSIGEDITTRLQEAAKAAAPAKSPELCRSFIAELYEFKSCIDVTVKGTLPASVDMRAKEQALWNKVINANEQVMEAVAIALASYADGAPHEMGAAEFVEDPRGIRFFMHVFRALTKKLNFEVYFRGMLTSRLLYDHGLNQVHSAVVANLKEECGAAYVAKLEALISDHNNSCKIADEFRSAQNEALAKLAGNAFPFSTLVVSKDTCIRAAPKEQPPADDAFQDCEVDGAAPQDTPLEVKVDPGLQVAKQLQDGFIDLYTARYKNRAVEYLPEFGSATLEMELNGACYELKVSACQAYCLLALNQMEQVSLSALRELMGNEYNEPMMREHLAVLNAPSSPVVVFRHPGISFATCTADDRFGLNPAFVPAERVLELQHRRPMFDERAAAESTHNAVEDITPAMEATIVRHLKINLEDSASNVFKVCAAKHPSIDRFYFNKVVDSLTERDFLRFEPQQDKLKYVP
ncbi:Cullin family protein, putative [Babesia bigemina]|uniref:Cullin family protein, putative n=1 Tax=Babesia bigemina TaxID=5866 RepID=A0A061D6T7_BABBI|nr:Cullin family protein, putative [Babesia bigemina]CDR96411.1 Cullin family protein, putative [Babesia bigemina]|eukprot:XP_012768597.1 Cullin family protein, putative [Babesia bigemina]